jgi:hypothetical protein
VDEQTRTAIRRYDIPVGLGSVAVVTAIFALMPSALSSGVWAMMYLPLVFLVAYFTTPRAAAAATALSVLGWMYFLVPPYKSFMMDDARDPFTLVVFLVLGILVAMFGGRRSLFEAPVQATKQPQPMGALDTALLNRLSAQLVSQSNIDDAARSMLESLRKVTGAQRVTMYLPDEIGRLKPAYAYPDEASKRDPLTTAIARWVSNEGRAFQIELREITSDEQHEWLGMPPPGQLEAEYMGDQIFVPIQTASFRAGVLHISARADRTRHSEDNDAMMLVISNLLAAFQERRRTLTLGKNEAAKPGGSTASTPQVSTPRVSTPLNQQVGPDEEEAASLDSQLERLNQGIENLIRSTNPPAEEEKGE